MSTAVSALILDIEGTTTPIDFVHRTLFPFSRKALPTYLRSYWGDARMQGSIGTLREEYLKEHGEKPLWEGTPEGPSCQGAIDYLIWLIDRDRKSTTLKELQGEVWRCGYENGTLKGDLFPDVPPALARWKEEKIPVSIFSSGSVLAQQLLFRHSVAGDLTPLIDSYFDTHSGPKREPDSYRNIASKLARECKEILFISDIPAELQAAELAGLRVMLSVRPGNAALEPHPFREIRSFAELTYSEPHEPQPYN